MANWPNRMRNHKTGCRFGQSPCFVITHLFLNSEEPTILCERDDDKGCSDFAIERINSQAKALGIERPYLRSGSAIANQNTLIYILINLRFLQRIRNHLTETN